MGKLTKEVETVTEQEAINEIRNRECIECIGNEIECGSCFYKMAIKALEEIQQYRAIGVVSPDELEQDLLLYKADRELVRLYSEIGTVEECRENKEFLEFLYNRINPNDMEQYLSMYHGSDEKVN